MDNKLRAVQLSHNVPDFGDPRITYERNEAAQFVYVDDKPVYGVNLPPSEKVLSDQELYQARLQNLLDFEMQTERMQKDLAVRQSAKAAEHSTEYGDTQLEQDK